MAAPDYVPTNPTQRVRRYQSPPRRSASWSANRPGDLTEGQPSGVRLGNQGPDQGYIFTLVPLLRDDLHLGSVVYDDAVAGCVAVALKRAAHYGRAPVIHDLRIAYTVFGFLDPTPPAELVALRERVFEQVGNNHHYEARRAIADMVPIDSLSKNQFSVDLLYESDWQSNFS